MIVLLAACQPMEVCGLFPCRHVLCVCNPMRLFTDTIRSRPPPCRPLLKIQLYVCETLQGDLDALLQYIDDNGDVNQRDRDNNTPLHWACQESHFDIVGVLMSRNAAVDPVNDLQSTPLHYACREVRKPRDRFCQVPVAWVVCGAT